MNNEDNIIFTIYYKNRKTSSLLLKNNTCPKPEGVRESHIVYKFTCPEGDCTPLGTYVGMTTTTLSRRLTLHLQQGGPKTHMRQHHRIELRRDTVVSQTEILARETDPRRLAFLEALYIKDLQPSINNQVQDLAILPSMRTINPRHLHRPQQGNEEIGHPAGGRSPSEERPPSNSPNGQRPQPTPRHTRRTEDMIEERIFLPSTPPSGGQRPQRRLDPPGEGSHAPRRSARIEQRTLSQAGASLSQAASANQSQASAD